MWLYCSDNSKICSCGGDRQIFYWDVSTGCVIRKFRGHDSEVSKTIPYTPLNIRLASIYKDVFTELSCQLDTPCIKEIY